MTTIIDMGDSIKLSNIDLEHSKTCGCCGLVFKHIASGTVNLGFLWHNCACGSTLVVSAKDHPAIRIADQLMRTRDWYPSACEELGLPVKLV